MTGALAVAVCAVAALGAAAAPVAATTETAAIPETVHTGPTESLGEPVAAGDAAVSVVAATKFATPPPPAWTLVGVWTRPAGSTWTHVGDVLPAGFGFSYDPSAAASPGGPLLVVAGAAPSGANCAGNPGIPNGSIAIANVDSRGKLGAARLVSDQRGTGSFDDRPVVAVGQDGTVWVAWSQGQNSDACQNVGVSDRLEVAVSHDGGQTFGAPVTMPSDGGDSAFGARLAPLSGGRVAVSWTETMSGGDQAVLVSVLGPGGQLTQTQQVLIGNGPPPQLPDASFLDFPAGDIVALPGNRLMVAAPFWRSGQNVIKLAVGAPGGQWQASVVSPPGGADLLLPALGLLSANDVRLLCAVHTRSDDGVGYDWADVRVSGQGVAPVSAGLTPLTPAPAGQGFYEIGEELSLSPTPDGLLTSFVVAGTKSAALQTATFTAPLPVVAPSAKATSPSAKATSAASRPAAHTAPPTSGTAGSGGGQRYVTAALTAGGVLFCAVLALGGWRVSRRQANRRGRHSVDWRAGPSADWRAPPPADWRAPPPADWRAPPPADRRAQPPPDRRPAPPPPDRRPAPPPPDRRPAPPPPDRRPGPPPPDWPAQPPANRPGR